MSVGLVTTWTWKFSPLLECIHKYVQVENSVAVNNQNNRKQTLIGVVDREARKIFSLCLGRSCEANVGGYPNSDTTIGGGWT